MQKNIHFHSHPVKRTDREELNQHKALVVWMTGLSGSGKSTLAGLAEKKLHQKKIRTYILDGDNIRKGLNKDLGFDDNSRIENIRRIAEVAKLMADAGLVVFTAFISPFREERERARQLIGEDLFTEVYVKCTLEVCEERDVKGLYQKARAGEIKDFTGIQSNYEPPKNPELFLDTDKRSEEECTDELVDFILIKLGSRN